MPEEKPQPFARLLPLLLMAVIFGLQNAALADEQATPNCDSLFVAPQCAENCDPAGWGKDLDSSAAFDNRIRKIMDQLDAINCMRTRVFWTDTPGAYADPDAGIGLSRTQLNALKAQSPTDDFDDDIRFVLAHEQSHFVQFRILAPDALAVTDHRRTLECQADLLGGMTVVLSFLHDRRTVDDFKKTSQQWENFAILLGEPGNDQSRHPNPGERARCIVVGMSGALQQIDVMNYRHSHDPAALRRITSERLINPDLFGVNDDIFDWSKGVAKGIVGYQSTTR